MPRSYQIFGPAMVCVNFGAHVPVVDILQFQGEVAAEKAADDAAQELDFATLTRFSDLGLTVDAVDIRVNFLHADVKADSYGPAVPVDKQWVYADAHIRTRLIHYDPDILELCLREACAGGENPTGALTAGGFALAGLSMGGGGLPAERNFPFIPNSGYHFVSLNIIPSVIAPNSLPWRFPAAYISQKPIIMPLGTQRSIVDIHWHAIPYGVMSQAQVAQLSGGNLNIFTAATIPDVSANQALLDDFSGKFNSGLSVWLFDHTADHAVV